MSIDIGFEAADLPNLSDDRLRELHLHAKSSIDDIDTHLEQGPNAGDPEWASRARFARRRFVLAIQVIDAERTRRREARRLGNEDAARESQRRKLERIALANARDLEQAPAFIKAIKAVLTQRFGEEYARELFAAAGASMPQESEAAE